MNATNIGFIKLLENQKKIRILFVILNIFAWFADNRVEQNIDNNNSSDDNLSKQIYICIIVISLIVNIYYLYVNSTQHEASLNDDKQNYREAAIILTIIALIIFLYVEIIDPSKSLDESIIN
ncbi:MAG: hypothetical protein PUD59_01350 [bacterium]|nr:hypothetical protein [bacterium]